MRTLVMGLLVLSMGVSAAWAGCPGDCNDDGVVAVNELVGGVNIAVGNAPVAQCPAFDSSGDGQVTVNELVGAVASLLNGCPFTGQYSARIDVGDGETGVLHLQVAPDGSATGTLSVAAASAPGRAALQIEIPLLTLTGTVDLDSGTYHLTGSVQGPSGAVPVDVSGVLPASPGGSGTVQLDIGPQSFSGNIAAGNGQPTPTATVPVSTPTASATAPAASPTPTATAVPANFPTPGKSCGDGSVSLSFSAANGTNSYADLGKGLNVGKATFTVIGQVGFGAISVPCSVKVGDIIRRIQLTYIGSAVTQGSSIPLGRAFGQGTFDYIETPVSNPLGTRGWRADSGTLVIDALADGMIRFHISGAQMSSEPSFSIQAPAAGTFVIDAGAKGKVMQQ